jgi:hypothetical protein
MNNYELKIVLSWKSGVVGAAVVGLTGLRLGRFLEVI